MRSIMINELRQVPLEKRPMEICERKGVGHPDSICDALMNQISNELSKEYMKRFGSIMHHNIDKGLLVAGEVERRFGGGEVTKPMLMVFGDRATFIVDNDEVPVKEITIETAKRWFRENMRFVDPETHVNYQFEIKRGSAALTDIFRRTGEIYEANDTSAAVGFSPLTPTERIVLETEQFLNSREFKKSFPETGEDVKVMGVRRNNTLHLTIAMAFVDRFINDEACYFDRKGEILSQIQDFVSSRVDFEEVTIDLNTLDRRGRGIGGMYLTVLGTSADDGDCGQVGRGNRVNGIIPLNRPSGSEAAAGKNPVSHVGKIYNLLSYKIADEIVNKVPGVAEVYVWLVSQIGRTIDQPILATAEVIPEGKTRIKDVSKQVSEVIDSELADIKAFCNDLIYGNIKVC
ncbi:MAG: methionine adenosyltransferase [Candidatus Bathyarchaeia archaeon]